MTTRRHLLAVALCCFHLGTCSHEIGYLESSASLIDRNAAIITLKIHNFPATTKNVNAYLAGVASVMVST